MGINMPQFVPRRQQKRPGFWESLGTGVAQGLGQSAGAIPGALFGGLIEHGLADAFTSAAEKEAKQREMDAAATFKMYEAKQKQADFEKSQSPEWKRQEYEKGQADIGETLARTGAYGAQTASGRATAQKTGVETGLLPVEEGRMQQETDIRQAQQEQTEDYQKATIALETDAHNLAWTKLKYEMQPRGGGGGGDAARRKQMDFWMDKANELEKAADAGYRTIDDGGGKFHVEALDAEQQQALRAEAHAARETGKQYMTPAEFEFYKGARDQYLKEHTPGGGAAPVTEGSMGGGGPVVGTENYPPGSNKPDYGPGNYYRMMESQKTAEADKAEQLALAKKAMADEARKNGDLYSADIYDNDAEVKMGDSLKARNEADDYKARADLEFAPPASK